MHTTGSSRQAANQENPRRSQRDARSNDESDSRIPFWGEHVKGYRTPSWFRSRIMLKQKQIKTRQGKPKAHKPRKRKR